MAHARSAHTRKKTHPTFTPLFTVAQVADMERDYQKQWGASRRTVLMTLASSAAQLIEGFHILNARDYDELMGMIERYQSHCQAGIELAQSAKARIEAAGHLFLQQTTHLDHHHEGAAA